jgi:hypothetical protein
VIDLISGDDLLDGPNSKALYETSKTTSVIRSIV